jgi:hypothetical protein
VLPDEVREVVQEPGEPTLLPQTVKSPLAVIPEIVNATSPVLVRVTAWGALVVPSN